MDHVGVEPVGDQSHEWHTGGTSGLGDEVEEADMGAEADVGAEADGCGRESLSWNGGRGGVERSGGGRNGDSGMS